MNYLITYALSMLNIPYVWGGNNPLQGMDCSGFIQCILVAAGLDPIGDQTAQALYDHFVKEGRLCEPQSLALIFYGENEKQITHIAFILDKFSLIEAGGGDSTVINKDIAVKKGAYIRIRPLNYR